MRPVNNFNEYKYLNVTKLVITRLNVSLKAVMTDVSAL